MNRRLAIRNLIAAGAGSLLNRLGASDSPAEKPEDGGGYVLRSDVRLVLLDVSVKDSKGGFVSGLAKENFNVRENGRPQQITVFANDDVPVTLGILVDESRSMTPKRAEVIVAAEIFIQESNPRDEIFILHFNERVRRGLPPDTLFSDDIEQLAEALRQGSPAGKTALNDAVVAGLRQLELGRRDKKALVLITDGGDNASTHTRQDVLDMVERNVATIYTVGLFDPEDPDRDPSILRKLSRISGGVTYLPANLDEMIPTCRHIAKDIRTRYTIGYAPPAANGSLRHVEVHGSAPGHGDLSIRTRTRYRYDEVESQKSK